MVDDGNGVIDAWLDVRNDSLFLGADEFIHQLRNDSTRRVLEALLEMEIIDGVSGISDGGEMNGSILELWVFRIQHGLNLFTKRLLKRYRRYWLIHSFPAIKTESNGSTTVAIVVVHRR